MAERDVYTEVADGDQLNEGYFNDIVSWATVPAILNTIRILEDHTTTFSDNTDDLWGEAYITVGGRLSSVAAVSSDIGYDTVNHAFFPGDFSASEDDSANITATDSNDEGDVFCTVLNDGTVAKRLNTVRFVLTAATDGTLYFNEGSSVGNVIGSIAYTGSSGLNAVDVSSLGICIMPSKYISVQYANGSNDIIANSGSAPSGSLNDTTLSATVGQTLDLMTTVAVGNFAAFSFIDDAEGDGNTGTVQITVPTGTFNTTITGAIIKNKIYTTETGATVEAKIANASDDSGYLTDGALKRFTVFGAGEPTKIITQLTGKSSSAAVRTPAISGTGVFAT